MRKPNTSGPHLLHRDRQGASAGYGFLRVEERLARCSAPPRRRRGMAMLLHVGHSVLQVPLLHLLITARTKTGTKRSIE